MDLIDKINELIKGLDLQAPIIDLHYDNQDNVVGHITDESFIKMTDEDAQSLIWNSLKKKLDSPELIRIIAIFHETPQDRVERIQGYRSREIKHSKFWLHQTPELTKYWLFVDVAKFGDSYKSFFLIINEKEDFNKGLTFVYEKDVLEFMELEQDEIHKELYTNVFNNGEVDIKMELMKRYEELSSKNLNGKANRYWYVYEDFQLTPASKSQLLFTQKEISMIQKGLDQLDDYDIKNELGVAMKKSEIFNKLKKEIK